MMHGVICFLFNKCLETQNANDVVLNLVQKAHYPKFAVLNLI